MAEFKLRDLRKAIRANDGTRSLAQSILVPEVAHAIALWEKNADLSDCVLIGGLAFSFYAKPRYTEDVDFLYLSKSHFPDEVKGFKRVRPSAFVELKTHVEVDLTSHESFGNKVPQSLVQEVHATARKVGHLRIASPEGIVALKLCSDRLKDKADVVELLKAHPINLNGWPLTVAQLAEYAELSERAKNESA